MIRSNYRRNSNIWKTLCIFLAIFTILSESYLGYKFIQRGNEIESKEAEIAELLRIIHSTKNGSYKKGLSLPTTTDGQLNLSKGLVSRKEFNSYKNETREALRRLQRELKTLKKNSLLSTN